MLEIKNYFAQLISPDKLLHFLYGFSGFWIAGMFLELWAALLIVLLIAIANEFYFWKYEETEFSIADISFTVIPGILIIFL